MQIGQERLRRPGQVTKVFYLVARVIFQKLRCSEQSYSGSDPTFLTNFGWPMCSLLVDDLSNGDQYRRLDFSFEKAARLKTYSVWCNGEFQTPKGAQRPAHGCARFQTLKRKAAGRNAGCGERCAALLLVGGLLSCNSRTLGLRSIRFTAVPPFLSLKLQELCVVFRRARVRRQPIPFV